MLWRARSETGSAGAVLGILASVATVLTFLFMLFRLGPFAEAGKAATSERTSSSTTMGSIVTATTVSSASTSPATVPSSTTSPPPRPPPPSLHPTLYLADQNAFRPSDYNNADTGRASVNGQLYTRCLRLHSYSTAFTSSMTYVLGRRFERLQGVVGIDDEARGGLRLRMRLVADGRNPIRTRRLKG